MGTDLIAGDATNNIASGYAYRATGALKIANYGNGRKLTLGYNGKRSQLTGLAVRMGETDPILSLDYNYYADGGGSDGNNGRIRHVNDLVNGLYTADFSYDDFNRLTGYGPNNRRSYTFDAWGNLQSVTAEGAGEPSYQLSYEEDSDGVPVSNRISNAGYDFDEAGNQTSDGTQSFTFDGANRLKTASGNAGIYGYDGDGRRVKQSNSAGTVHYLWSSVLGEPALELTPDGVYRAYVYSPSGGLLGLQSPDGYCYWVHGDHLGSGRRLTDGSGAVVYEAEFDPHGQMLREWVDEGEDLYKNSHKFTGYERDWATDLDNAKARSFAYKRGRFLQPDPLGIAAADPASPQSLNRYSYVGNDPVNFTDPEGLFLASDDTIRIETWEEGPWWDFWGWWWFFGGWGGGGGTLGPIEPQGGGGGGSSDNNRQELPVQLGPQEQPCEDPLDPLKRAVVDIYLNRSGLNQFVLGKSVSRSGEGYLLTLNDPIAARKFIQNRGNFSGGGSFGGTFHKNELATDQIADFRSFTGLSGLGSRSLQVVFGDRRAYVDTDRFNYSQDVVGAVGHSLLEVLPFIVNKALERIGLKKGGCR